MSEKSENENYEQHESGPIKQQSTYEDIVANLLADSGKGTKKHEKVGLESENENYEQHESGPIKQQSTYKDIVAKILADSGKGMEKRNDVTKTNLKDEDYNSRPIERQPIDEDLARMPAEFKKDGEEYDREHGDLGFADLFEDYGTGSEHSSSNTGKEPEKPNSIGTLKDLPKQDENNGRSENIIEGEFGDKFFITTRGDDVILTGIEFNSDDDFERSTYVPKEVTTIGLPDSNHAITIIGKPPMFLYADNVLRVSPNAFKNTNIESVYLNGAEFIGSNAFENSTLEYLEANNALMVDDHAFSDCKKLKGIWLERVEDMGDYVFSGCDEITDKQFHINPDFKPKNENTFAFGVKKDIGAEKDRGAGLFARLNENFGQTVKGIVAKKVGKISSQKYEKNGGQVSQAKQKMEAAKSQESKQTKSGDGTR